MFIIYIHGILVSRESICERIFVLAVSGSKNIYFKFFRLKVSSPKTFSFFRVSNGFSTRFRKRLYSLQYFCTFSEVTITLSGKRVRCIHNIYTYTSSDNSRRRAAVVCPPPACDGLSDARDFRVLRTRHDRCRRRRGMGSNARSNRSPGIFVFCFFFVRVFLVLYSLRTIFLAVLHILSSSPVLYYNMVRT